MDVNDLIDKAGGPKAIAQASRRPRKLSVFAVQKWRKRGIPDGHWDLIMSLTGVPLEVVYRANRSFRADKAA